LTWAVTIPEVNASIAPIEQMKLHVKGQFRRMLFSGTEMQSEFNSLFSLVIYLLHVLSRFDGTKIAAPLSPDFQTGSVFPSEGVISC
jgi:hypothetical protein